MSWFVETGFEIALAFAEIEPRALLHVIGSELLFRNQLEKRGNHGDFFVIGNQIEDFGVNTVNAGELVSPRFTVDHSFDVRDLVSLKGEVLGRTILPDGQGGDVVPHHVSRDELIEGEVGENVSIVNEGGIVSHPLGDIFDAPPGFEKVGLVEEAQAGTAIGRIGEGGGPRLWKMVGVDRDLNNPGLDEMVHGMGDQRPVFQRNERLWQSVGERLEASAESGSEKKCFPHKSEVA